MMARTANAPRARDHALRYQALIDQIAAQERILALAESLSGVGHWRLDLATGKLEWSAEVYRIFGVTPTSFSPDLNSALAFYDPPSRAAVQTALEHTLATGASLNLQATLARASDGDDRRVLARGEIQRDAAGRPCLLFGVIQDITDQARSLERVTEERERYRLLADNATDVIATYQTDGVFTFISPAIERLVGKRPLELLGCKTYALIHPDDHARVTRRFRALIEGGAPSARIEYRALRADGSSIWVEAHPTPIRDAEGRVIGFQDVVRDISARKAAEEMARDAAEQTQRALAEADASESRYRQLAETANDMLASMGPDSTVHFVSPACRRVLGYEPEELIGRKTLALTHPDDLGPVQTLFAQLIAAGPDGPLISYQFRARHKAGHWVWLEGQPRIAFDATGAPVLYRDVVRDITARKALEAALRAERARAEEAATVASEFLANMSHELRTPLTSIIGFSQLLRERQDLPEQARGHVARVHTGSQALLATVNDILDFSKLEAGQVEFVPRLTRTRDLGAEVLSLFILQAQSKSLVLEVASEAAVPDCVWVDPDRLRQVLLNLVGNAVKFTARGGVMVQFRYRSGRLRVEVMDTGAGIPLESQHLLFKRFSQVDGSTARTHGGAGLGLAICKGIVDAMGGELGVQSAKGQGATFWFEAPAPRAKPRSKVVPPPTERTDLEHHHA